MPGCLNCRLQTSEKKKKKKERTAPGTEDLKCRKEKKKKRLEAQGKH